MPLGLWEQRWIWVLSAKALALLTVLLDLQGGKRGACWIADEDKRRYGLSPDTWRLASKELVDVGLLTVTSVIESHEFEMPRRRKAYRINTQRLDEPAPMGEK